MLSIVIRMVADLSRWAATDVTDFVSLEVRLPRVLVYFTRCNNKQGPGQGAVGSRAVKQDDRQIERQTNG